MLHALMALIFLGFSHFAVENRGQSMPVSAPVVEEIVAAVGTTPILASDLDLAALVVIASPESGETATQYRARLLDARIRLELQYRDLEQSGALYRLDLDVAAVLEELHLRAGGEATLSAGLAALGLGSTEVEELAVRIAATDAYVEQRLRPRVSVSVTEMEEAYRHLVVAELVAAGQEAPPLTSVKDELVRLLVERKLNAEIENWLERARDRQDVTRFHP